MTWKFGCLAINDGRPCSLHFECHNLYHNTARLLKLLFNENTQRLCLNFNKIDPKNHRDVVNTLIDLLGNKRLS